jgi:Protein of unknown function (DUF3152)
MAKPANGSQRPRSSTEEPEARPARAADATNGRDRTIHARTGTNTARDPQPRTPRSAPGDPRRGRPAPPDAVPGAAQPALAGGGTRGTPRRTPGGGRTGSGTPAGRGGWAARDADRRRGGGAAAQRLYRAGTGNPRRPTVVSQPPVVSPGRQRMLRRRRRSMVLLVLLVAAVVIGVDQLTGNDDATVPAGTSAPAAGPQPSAAPAPSEAVSTAMAGTGFAHAASAGPVVGTAGTLRRFRVAAENGTGEEVNRFAATIDQVLGDPRSWIASRQVRLQRVPRTAAAEFTIWLATAATSERMCHSGGLNTEGYTSCRLPGHVVINLDRWRKAIPGYGAPLAVYQAYAINHEVGHQLGYDHEACPGAGEPAPVMQQQTYGLKGCVANPWPYLDGKRYTGPPLA